MELVTTMRKGSRPLYRAERRKAAGHSYVTADKPRRAHIRDSRSCPVYKCAIIELSDMAYNPSSKQIESSHRKPAEWKRKASVLNKICRSYNRYCYRAGSKSVTQGYASLPWKLASELIEQLAPSSTKMPPPLPDALLPAPS